MEHGYKQLLFCKDGRAKMMRLGIMASFVQEFSGIIPILSYLTTLFNSFGGGVFLSRSLTTISGAVKMLSVMSVLPFIDKWGRRPIFIFGSIFMGLFMGLVGVFSEFVESNFLIPFFLIELFLFAYEASAGPLCWIYTGEILCPKGMSIAISSNWLFMTITALSFPFLIELFGVGFTFFIYSAINFACAVYCWLDFIETKGMDKGSIQAILMKKN
jgi:SP family arabinose:H+ symporter-like MFS transporter